MKSKSIDIFDPANALVLGRVGHDYEIIESGITGVEIARVSCERSNPVNRKPSNNALLFLNSAKLLATLKGLMKAIDENTHHDSVRLVIATNGYANNARALLSKIEKGDE